MKKLVVINSFGPMASTLLAGLLEKFAFTNIPLRKMNLHQYLMGEYSLSSGRMESRLKEIMLKHSLKTLSGGVSVLDRANQVPRALVDMNIVKDRFNSIPQTSLQDLYFSCRRLYSESVIYKKVTSNPNYQIEMTVDIHRYDPENLYKAYRNNFDDVRMIHLHRPIDKWISSLASQAFVHPEIANRLMFFPHFRCADYARYETSINSMPGLHIHFDELFSTPIQNLAENLSKFLEIPVPDIAFEHEKYDMYGKIQPYDIAFKKFDDKVTFLSSKTINYIVGNFNKNTIGKSIPAFFSWLLYLRDMIFFRYKQSKAI